MKRLKNSRQDLNKAQGSLKQSRSEGDAEANLMNLTSSPLNPELKAESRPDFNLSS